MSTTAEPTTADRLTALEELREAASPGMWTIKRTLGDMVVDAWGVFVAAFSTPLHKKAEANAALAAQAPALAASCIAMGKALERIGYDENTSYLACPGPPHCDKSHYETCPVQIAQVALDTIPEAENDGWEA